MSMEGNLVSQRGVRISKIASRRVWPTLTLMAPFFEVHFLHPTRVRGLTGDWR